MRRAFVLPFLLVLLGPLAAQAPAPGPAKREDVRTLLRLLGAGENGVKALKGAMDAQRGTNPQIPEAFFTAFEAEFTAQRIEDAVLPIYEKHLDAAEVKALLAFLATPEGRSYTRKQGVILEESMQAGQKLGEQVGREVAERLQAEGKL
ncbi:MAG TPA: DUF2059 domain-containing protein [Holophagaceae bacterium]|nr:DUF2059 domain-containing protein [Holophagaceae bacterium]